MPDAGGSERKRKAEAEDAPSTGRSSRSGAAADAVPAPAPASDGEQLEVRPLKPENLRAAYDGDAGKHDYRIAPRHLTITNTTPDAVHLTVEVGDVWDWELLKPSTSHTFPTRRKRPLVSSSVDRDGTKGGVAAYAEACAYCESAPRDDAAPVYRVVRTATAPNDVAHKIVSKDADGDEADAPTSLDEGDEDLLAMSVADLELQIKPPRPPTPPPDPEKKEEGKDGEAKDGEKKEGDGDKKEGDKKEGDKTDGDKADAAAAGDAPAPAPAANGDGDAADAPAPAPADAKPSKAKAKVKTEAEAPAPANGDAMETDEKKEDKMDES